MNWTRVVVALTVLAALGGYVYFFEIRGDQKKTEKERTEKSLFSLKKDEITELVLERPEGTGFTLTRHGKDWTFTSPRPLDAADSEVNYMVERLTSASWTDSVDSTKLQDFGLDKPRAKVILKDSGGRQEEVDFGNVSPVGMSVYLAKGGKVYLGDQGAFDAADRQVEQLREKHLFLLDSNDIEELTISHGDKAMTLKKSAGRWDIVAPIQFPADSGKVDTLARSVGFFEFNKIVDETGADAKKYGLAPPDVTLIVKTKENGKSQEETALFGKVDKDDWYAKRADSPEIGVLSARLKSDLSADPDSYRKLQILSLDRFTINHIEGMYRQKEFALKLDDLQKWQRSKPKSGEVKWADINDFLDAVITIKAEGATRVASGDLAPYGLDKPEASMSFYDDKGALLGRFIASEKKGAGYAKEDSGNVVYTLSPGHWDKLMTGLKKLDGDL